MIQARVPVDVLERYDGDTLCIDMQPRAQPCHAPTSCVTAPSRRRHAWATACRHHTRSLSSPHVQPVVTAQTPPSPLLARTDPAMPPASMTTLNTLPHEILLEVLHHVDIPDLFSLSKVRPAPSPPPL